MTLQGYEALVSQRTLRGDHARTVPDPVFPTITHLTRRTGEADFTGVAREQWKKARVAAGYPTLRWHDLRHVYAVTAVRAGVPLGDLMNLLGHSSLVMVLRYARHSPANFKEQTRDRIERFRRGEGHVEEAVGAGSLRVG